jgi:hypothetical protein
MCASVLNKCQNYTYSDGKFKNDNQVVREYLQRTLTQIKVAQDEIISSYAENCISDVNSCLSSNNYTAQANYAINACKAQIVTCMSVNGDATATPTPSAMTNWVKTITGTLQASSSEPSEPEDTPEVTCERGYQLFNGSCIKPTPITIVHIANGGEGSTKFYAIDGKAYEYQSGGAIGGQITKITPPTKANATYIGATQASTYNSGDKLCISSSGQINLANCAVGQNYSHWKCSTGYTLNGTSCVKDMITMKIVNDYRTPFSTITNENFVCSPDSDTQIKIKDYVDIDVVTAENNGLNAGCIRLCYDSAASDPTVNNASTYCDKVPAKSCVSGGKMYLLVDEYCAS